MINPLKIIKKYYPKGSEIYYVLLTHSQKVQEKALNIAIKHPDLTLDIDFISEASLLHDIGIFKCYAPKIHCNGAHHYIEHGYLGADILRYEGLPKHALVCERHTGVGISKKTIIENNFPLPIRDMIPLSLEEQLVCYADKFYSKTNLTHEHSIEKIRKQLLKFGTDQLAVFDKWHAIFK